MYSDFRQLRDEPNIPEFVAGDVAKLILDRIYSSLEPDSRDRISMTVHGSYADRNDRLPLGLGQLFVIERDDNDPHTAVRRNEKIRFWCPGPSSLFPY
jgi:hypothetical protein